MNQEWLIKNVLKHLNSVPDTPIDDREYLSLEEAQRIVDDTVEYVGVHGDNIEYNYINGHRKRLAHSLSMIPMAKCKGESCLDVGSYGYMLFWLKKHLGYDHVAGIEWHPDIDDKIIHQTLTLNDETVGFDSHNFDISQSDWALDGTYDTILFFEVLEHINHDPMGVMTRIHERLKLGGTLVMSVPNAISYKAFKEFLVGMPPWTYWFYEPDLSHEPRHCFEYTPIVFKTIIQATGLRENAFRIIYAYTDQDREEPTLEIARSFGIDDGSFGETMIINSTKTSKDINLRFPDVLYSPEGYYRHVFPHLHERLDKAIACFREVTASPTMSVAVEPGKIESNSPQVDRDLSHEVAAENVRLHEQISELLYTCDTQLHQHDELQEQIKEIESERAKVSDELVRSRALVLNLEKQKNEMADRVNELLFTCDCYMRKEVEHETTVKEIERARDAALVEAGDTRVWAEELTGEITDLRRQIEEVETERGRIAAELNDAQESTLDLQKRKNEMESRINELLFTCDCYMRKEVEHDTVVKEIERARDAALVEAGDTRVWAEGLTGEITDLRLQIEEVETERSRIAAELNDAQELTLDLQKRKNEMESRINELLFTCDCYMRKEVEHETTVKEIERARDAALVEAGDTRVRAEELTGEITDLRRQIEEVETERGRIAAELNDARESTLDLQKQKNEMESRINELLFTCDCYMRKEVEHDTVVKEIERARDAALGEAGDTRVWAEELTGEVTDLRLQIEEVETERSRIAAELSDAQESTLDLQKRKNEMESRINELLFTCDCYMRKEVEHDTVVKEIENARDAALVEARDTRVWSENLTTEIDELRGRINEIESEKVPLNNELEQSQDCIRELQKQKAELEVRVNELLFTCDCYMRKEGQNTSGVAAAEEARDAALREARDTRVWAEKLTKENTDLRGQVNELLFACDCYLQQVNDPARCVQVIREKRFRSALETSKSIARKTPILRTALRPVYQTTKKFIKRRM